MFSTSRRCTASSSAIKMLAAMAFPAHYNYLSRIGALWLMPINALLNLDVPPVLHPPQLHRILLQAQPRCPRALYPPPASGLNADPTGSPPRTPGLRSY